MDGMNKGFKKATDKFEKIIETSEKIVVNADKILEILLEGQHNVIVIVGAATVAVLVLMVLMQIAYMIKLARHLRERNVEWRCRRSGTNSRPCSTIWSKKSIGQG